jgi:hypothetical protein
MHIACTPNSSIPQLASDNDFIRRLIRNASASSLAPRAPRGTPSSLRELGKITTCNNTIMTKFKFGYIIIKLSIEKHTLSP